MSGYKTRSSKPFLVTPFDNPERQFQEKRNNSPVPIHNIFSFYESKSSKSESETDNEHDIEEITMNQYLGKTNKSCQRTFDTTPDQNGYSRSFKNYIINNSQGKTIRMCMNTWKKCYIFVSLSTYQTYLGIH